MIRYILIGISVLYSGIVNSQYTKTQSASTEKKSINGRAATGFISYNLSKYTLPKKAAITGYFKEKKLYSGTTRGHQLNKQWQSWYANGNPCDSGTLIRGIPDGIWKTWDSEGRLTSLRTYDAGKFQRIKSEMIRYNPRMASWYLLKIYQRNKKQATNYLQAGYSYSFSGHRGYHLSLQQSVEENITPGNVYHPVFDDCLHHGLYINYYPNGLAKDSGYYKNGLKDGFWLHRQADRSFVTGAYKNGVRNGDWKTYAATGKITGIILYSRNGEEEWRRQIGSGE